MISSSLIREARLRAGLTQAELGGRAGKAASAISRWERGAATPSLETTVDLLKAAGFELTYGLARRDDHDLALIHRSLDLSPAQRLTLAVNAARTIRSMRQAARAGHG